MAIGANGCRPNKPTLSTSFLMALEPTVFIYIQIYIYTHFFLFKCPRFCLRDQVRVICIYTQTTDLLGKPGTTACGQIWPNTCEPHQLDDLNCSLSKCLHSKGLKFAPSINFFSSCSDISILSPFSNYSHLHSEYTYMYLLMLYMFCLLLMAEYLIS